MDDAPQPVASAIMLFQYCHSILKLVLTISTRSLDFCFSLFRRLVGFKVVSGA